MCPRFLDFQRVKDKATKNKDWRLSDQEKQSSFCLLVGESKKKKNEKRTVLILENDDGEKASKVTC